MNGMKLKAKEEGWNKRKEDEKKEKRKKQVFAG